MRRAVRVVVLGIGVAVGSPAEATTYTVTSTANAGMGTLRQAIEDANANVGVVDLIDFNIAGPPFTIQPTAALPTITDPVTIDGYTQNGATPNTMGIGTNAFLLIEIDGSLAGDTDGLLIEHVTGLGLGTTIRGLVINRFSNFLRAGIRINDDGNNLIEGNFIGTTVSGFAAAGNSDGVSIALQAAGNTVGGTTPASVNLISGNTNRGVVLDTNDNIIESNLIGTDRTGATALGNGAGIVLFMFAADNTIGGFMANGNTISGNNNTGIAIGSNSLSHDVIGNRIGVGANGVLPLGNGGPGILVGANDTRILNNVIAANGGTGIAISDVTGTVVQGNEIGRAGAPNAAGVSIIDGSDNLIGGTGVGEGNRIRSNDGVGVQVVAFATPADGNGILSNSISDNDGLGIELLLGANNGQPAPVLTSASGPNQIRGSLTAAALSVYRIEFFANFVCDTGGAGEGRDLLASITLPTDGAGQLMFDVVLPSSPGQPVITATATDPVNNTSQFSNCVLNQDAIATQAPALGSGALAMALLVLAGIGGRAMARRRAGAPVRRLTLTRPCASTPRADPPTCPGSCAR